MRALATRRKKSQKMGIRIWGNGPEEDNVITLREEILERRPLGKESSSEMNKAKPGSAKKRGQRRVVGGGKMQKSSEHDGARAPKPSREKKNSNLDESGKRHEKARLEVGAPNPSNVERGTPKK